jgi:putative transcriptional regulator
MKLDMDIFKARGIKLEPVKGRLLIAEPILPDVIFSRSVILIVDDKNNKHSGLIINKAAGIKLGKVLPDFKDADFNVHLGGPVETERLFYLHSYGDLIKGAIRITENLWWGGDFSTVKEMLHAGVLKSDKIMFFLGYSGWTEGQLRDELNDGAWLVADIPEKFVFSDGESQWSRSLNFVDEKYQIWRNFPEDPELN